MSEGISKTIQEAEELARKILRRKVRKALGIYYLLWSTFAGAIGLLYTLLYAFPSLGPFSVYLYIAIYVPYIALTSVIFYKAFSVRRILERRRRRQIFGTVIIILFVAVWIYLLYIYNNFSYYEVSAVIYSSIIAYQIYYIAKFTGKVKRYDYLAIITILISVILGNIFYALFYVYLFPWVYAGIRSIEDSYEGDRDAQ